MKKVLKFNLPFIIFLLFCNQTYAQNPVTWTGASGNTQVTGNSVTMTGGSKWSQGAYSAESITASTDGYVEVTVQATNKGYIFGLAIPPNNGQHFSSIDYGIFVRPDGKLNIFENGSGVYSNGGNYSVNDVLRVERTGQTVTYLRNGTLIYTSQTTSSTALIMDVSFRDANATAHNATIFVAGGACATTVYADTDGDGFGDPSATTTDCSDPLPSGWVANSDDCDDTNGDINPNTVWYADTDGDNFGDPAVTQTQCAQPVGYVLDNTDCDDTTNDPSNDCGGGGAGPSVWTQSGDDIRYSDGKVLIGDAALDISSVDYNLFVEKGIMTERIKVSLSSSADWADYVFKNGYQLMTLEEVWSHILEKGHLPNVPSAEQVAEQGIDVSKMFPTLLRQIEENKLYLIQMNEEIKKLKEENAALKQQNSK
ncbi:MAG: hypothetical protein AB8B69_19820 [Chitinophagales bacterium]